MDKYKCYECKKTFKEVNTIITHLRNVHSIREKIMQIKCVSNLNSYDCGKTFLSFGGLRKHLCAEKCGPTEGKIDTQFNETDRSPLNDEETFVYCFSDVAICLLFVR